MDNKVFKNCEYTQRGFAKKEFKDRFGAKCSLQESSNIIPSIWLGVDEEQDEEFNEKFKGAPSYTRMHLNYEQVQELVDDLQRWLRRNS